MISKEMTRKGIKLNELSPLLEPLGWFIHPEVFSPAISGVDSKDHSESGFRLMKLNHLYLLGYFTHPVGQHQLQ